MRCNILVRRYELSDFLHRPILKGVFLMSHMIYADHASTTALSPKALEAMMPYLTNEYGNPSGLYRFSQDAKTVVDNARAQMAAALNASPEEIFFTSGGTESDNWVLRGVADAKQKKGRHIITTAIEHHAILYTAKALEKQGYEFTILPVDSLGRVSPEDLKNALRPDTILVSVMAANNEIGTIEPVKELAAVAHAAGALFHTDAVQAVGHIPVDVKDWDVDYLSLSGHKFRGPGGVGALYVRKGAPITALITGGGQEKNRRSGTENVAGIVGMTTALAEAVEGLPAEQKRLSALRDKLIRGVLEIPRSHLTGDPDNRLPGTASFTFECIEGESLILRLDALGICSSSGSACSSKSLEPSHVLLAIGLPHEIAHGSLRLSIGEETTSEDVDTIIASVKKVVSDLRAMSPLWAA